MSANKLGVPTQAQLYKMRAYDKIDLYYTKRAEARGVYPCMQIRNQLLLITESIRKQDEQAKDS
jgi:hypothetical protein